MTTTTEPRAKTAVSLWKDGGWTRWNVTFADADQVLAYLERRNAGLDVLDRERVNVEELISEDELTGREVSRTFPEYGPLTPSQLRLLEYLYPHCHHGMDATMCMDPYGPNHWGTMEQELAGML